MKNSKPTKQTIILGILMLMGALLGQRTAHGYLHAADIFILLAAILLPTPHAAVAAGLTGVAVDLIKGLPLLAPATLLIKVFMVLAAKGLLKLSPSQKHPECMVGPAALVPVAGYYLYELILQLIAGNGFAAFGAAAGTLQKDFLQALASFLLFIFVYDLYMGIRSAKESIAAQKEQSAENSEEPQILE
ncbi:MAG: hypothetical protein IJ333_07170 [Clostridia bacterium]|nr:hypothetical protein [Clostridia bacterium]